MVLQRLEIDLNNPHRSYFAGQTVGGTVFVTVTDKPKKIQGKNILVIVVVRFGL